MRKYIARLCVVALLTGITGGLVLAFGWRVTCIAILMSGGGVAAAYAFAWGFANWNGDDD